MKNQKVISYLFRCQYCLLCITALTTEFTSINSTGIIIHEKPKRIFCCFYSNMMKVSNLCLKKKNLKSYESFLKIISSICVFLKWWNKIQSAKQKPFHTEILSITTSSGLVSLVSETWAMWFMSCNLCFRNMSGNLSVTCREQCITPWMPPLLSP